MTPEIITVVGLGAVTYATATWAGNKFNAGARAAADAAASAKRKVKAGAKHVQRAAEHAWMPCERDPSKHVAAEITDPDIGGASLADIAAMSKTIRYCTRCGQGF